MVASSAEARRQRILQVAKSHFERFGFRRTRIEDIARDAGIAKGAVYLEFESKEVLLHAVIEALFGEIGRRYAAEVMPLESPRERLRATLRFSYGELARDTLFERLVREDPELVVLRSLAESGDNPRKADAQVEMIRGWVLEGIERGEFRADLDVDVVPFVIGVLRFLHYHTGLVTTGDRISRERLLEAVIDIFIAGLSAPAPSPPSAHKSPGRGSRKR
ncbi:TetR/AcrR family transcriptional regulator [Vitiosangium sp. GDMCC 1.1324]|uniref:TetR/AcrR family transcriptional regulator n=1 Tax=Vitiosangium sp. (strain GDMCC 1.1324) TaxID=2138576 RepID=UPI000D3BFC84|nr:TetR/AcrR family transcriptional regulator [Vitiosangium sp. GDMCC 1.1324]PTL80882.1 TetR/AcrR family transcriptional regulator [Vitiosangium sp. GDMCC 1.1324]